MVSVSSSDIYYATKCKWHGTIHSSNSLRPGAFESYSTKLNNISISVGLLREWKRALLKKKFRKLSPMTHTHKVCFYQFLNSPSEKIGSPQRIALILPMAWGWSCNGRVSCVKYLILNFKLFQMLGLGGKARENPPGP